jgi:CBS domain-containing protein
MSHTLKHPTENIGKIMRKKVVKIPPDDTLRHAAQLMKELKIGSVVVVEGDRPVGIITERDGIRLLSTGKHPDTRAGEVMKAPVITCESSKKVIDVFEMMAENKIDHLPITENGKLVGIVASRDLLTAPLSRARTVEMMDISEILEIFAKPSKGN